MMQTNLQLDLAFNYLENTGTNIFLTGKAGTGKTTFLKKLKETSPKRMIVVAPTGVAAINAGGVPFTPSFSYLSDRIYRVAKWPPGKINPILINSAGIRSISSVVWTCS